MISWKSDSPIVSWVGFPPGHTWQVPVGRHVSDLEPEHLPLSSRSLHLPRHSVRSVSPKGPETTPKSLVFILEIHHDTGDVGWRLQEVCPFHTSVSPGPKGTSDAVTSPRTTLLSRVPQETGNGSGLRRRRRFSINLSSWNWTRPRPNLCFPCRDPVVLEEISVIPLFMANPGPTGSGSLLLRGILFICPSSSPEGTDHTLGLISVERTCRKGT